VQTLQASSESSYGEKTIGKGNGDCMMALDRTPDIPFEILKGKIIQDIEARHDAIYFVISDDEAYKMYHIEDCCESVELQDICGSLDNLIGAPILIAEERCQDGEDSDYHGTSTWTFYEIATINGSVTITWYGTSNGYYSERVNFKRCLQ
jgi:hypothetical protein